MKKNIIIGILFILLAVSLVNAGNLFPATDKNVSSWTGHEWTKLEEEQKAYYMAGFLSATSYYMGQWSDQDIKIHNTIVLEIVKDIDNFYKNNDLDVPITEAAE